MTTWQEELQHAVTDSAGLQRELGCEAAEAVIARYPMRISPYYADLIRRTGEPLFRQAVPDLQELADPIGMEDPLGEENLSPVPNLVHKYPDRVLLLISGQCAMYCRFCTRKRKVGQQALRFSEEHFAAALDYLRRTPAVREVLISGGDPFLLSDQQIEEILQRLREVKSIEVIRIGTRTLCTLPMRITPELAELLRKYHPLYINTHFNHSAELTAEAARACTLLADVGIPLGCQTVLLKGVNDSAEVLRELFCGLLRLRVRPYYLMQADLTKGTNHFRTPVKVGIEIMRNLIGTVSGMAVPKFVVDAPGGKGKIPLNPDYIIAMQDGRLDFVNYQGLPCSYPLD
jgi:lysine 2,3-aminomutase